MIKTDRVLINETYYKYTRSTLGHYIQRNDGKKFIDAYDDIDSNYTYIELPDSILKQELLLQSLYPVGAIYIGTMSVCPLETLGIGTWELKSSGKVLQGTDSSHKAGTEIAAGLPNITGATQGGPTWSNMGGNGRTGCVEVSGGGGWSTGTGHGTDYGGKITIDASWSNPIYGSATTVQPPAYVVNIWQRIS